MELRHTVACKKCGKSLISCQSYSDTEKIVNTQKSSCCDVNYNYIGLQVVQAEILNYSKTKDGILEVVSINNVKNNKVSKIIKFEDLKNTTVEEPKRRGRPAKAKEEMKNIEQVAKEQLDVEPKKRGRKPKIETSQENKQEQLVETPKRRGRPAKIVENVDVQEAVKVEHKKRGRPKSTTSLDEIDRIVEQEIKNDMPKRRGRPPKELQKVVAGEQVEQIVIKHNKRAV